MLEYTQNVLKLGDRHLPSGAQAVACTQGHLPLDPGKCYKYWILRSSRRMTVLLQHRISKRFGYRWRFLGNALVIRTGIAGGFAY